MKIVILDGFAVRPGDLSWERFQSLGEVVVYGHDNPDEFYERLTGADVAVTNKVVFDRERISRLPDLKLIAVAATGYNIIDCEAAREHGVIVTNIPAYSTDSVAQMVFAHLLNITNRVQYYADENRNGRWSKSPDFCYYDFTTHEIANQTLGIVGMGNIGTKVAAIAKEFGMKVIAHTHRQAEILPEGITKVELDELLATADVITLHCPLTAESNRMINSETIAKMKRGVVLINTGRGGLIDEQAVADALNDGQIGAFAADVLTEEPPRSNNPLLTAKNSYLTPHIAWASSEARERLMDIMYDNIASFISGTPINVVNVLH